jgi:hypothetical protein
LTEATIVNTLIKNGHAYSDIMLEYSREEVVVHYVSLVKLEAQETKRIAIATRAGVNADKEKFTNFIAALDGKEKGKDAKFREYLVNLALQKNKGKTPNPADFASKLPQRSRNG